MNVHRLHYVLAASPEAAFRLAGMIERGSIPAIASTPGDLLALWELHPFCYRLRLEPFLVYTGHSGLASKRLATALDR